jgi:hypothetical protein
MHHRVLAWISERRKGGGEPGPLSLSRLSDDLFAPRLPATSPPHFCSGESWLKDGHVDKSKFMLQYCNTPDDMKCLCRVSLVPPSPTPPPPALSPTSQPLALSAAPILAMFTSRTGEGGHASAVMWKPCPCQRCAPAGRLQRPPTIDLHLERDAMKAEIGASKSV